MREPSTDLFVTPQMAAIFASTAHVGRLLAFEAALARAEARAGIIPPEAPEAIAKVCRVELFDVAALYQEASLTGTLLVPLIHTLTDQVAGKARNYVHWGVTSQDAIDTAMVLQMREGLNLLITDLLRLCAACAALTEKHRSTIMAGRTLLQQALPIPFGLKTARWLALTMRQVQELRERRDRSLALQLGGAAGTLAALGAKGLLVAAFLAEELDLPLPELPWHAERDRVAMVAAALGVVAGAMAKIAGDILLLAQTEVGEAAEVAAPGKGISSAMPQKQNPVDATVAMASARLAIGGVSVVLQAMGQEHERAVGGWQAEWTAIPDLFCHTASAVARVVSAIEGLQINTGRMRKNLDCSGGLLMAESLTMALARRIDRQKAQRLVAKVVDRVRSDGITLRQAVVADEEIQAIVSADALDQALDPNGYLGSAGAFIDRALTTYHKAMEQGPA